MLQHSPLTRGRTRVASIHVARRRITLPLAPKTSNPGIKMCDYCCDELIPVATPVRRLASQDAAPAALLPAVIFACVLLFFCYLLFRFRRTAKRTPPASVPSDR